MEIKILGMGCPKCKTLYNNVEIALENLKIDNAKIYKVEKLQDILKYKVTITPALVINDKVVSSGKVLPVNEIKDLILNLKE